MPNLLDKALTMEPLPGESHSDFAIRFHEGLADSIPKTSERQAEMSRAWDEANPEGDDLDRYAAAECNPDKYELVRNVPYFDEHEKTHASGKVSSYGRDELASIVEKMNHRLVDSGNLPSLTDGHTPDDMDPDKMPAVLGYSGPFRLGMVGNKKPRWAIFANEHWLSKYSHLKDERRTRSVEIETAVPINDRYFHSVAALGALAPQRDTGMVRYQLSEERHAVEKYSSYGGAFTAMPSNGKRDSYADDGSTQNGGPMPNQNPSQPPVASQGQQLSENDALQVASEVVNALMQQPWVQWAMRMSQGDQGGGGQDGQSGDGSPAAAGQPPAASQGQQPQQDQPQADPTAGMDADEQAIHGALPDHLKPKFAAKCGKRSQPQQYADDAETEPDEITGLGTDDGEDTETDPANADTSPAATDTDTDSSNGDETVPKETTPAVAPEKYALLERQNKDLTERLSKLEKKERNVDRYQRLIDLKQDGDFVYDAKAELSDCDDMSDAQFEKHITKTIPEKYQRGGGTMPELFVEEHIERRPRIDKTVDQVASLNERDAIVKYATQHGLDYETAVERYRKEKSTEQGKAVKVS